MLSDKPQLFIIAGPNGAGKSTVSKNLLADYNIEAFDWDKEFYSSWAKCSYDPLVTDGIRESTNKKFQALYSKSLEERKSFAYETNFHSEQNFEIAHSFSNIGF